MRILFITQWFQPEPNFKGLPFVKEMQNLGHEVQVLTGFPNYPEGRLYSGYKLKLYQKEIIDGVSIVRTFLYPSHDSSRIRRVLNYGSFAIFAATLGPLLTRKVDLVYVYHPPAPIGLAAWTHRFFCGCPYVLDIGDLWPDTLAATGMFRNSLGLKMVGAWCKKMYDFASRIVVLSPGFKEKLQERGVPSSKIEVVYNWCEEDHIGTELPIHDEQIADRYGFSKYFNIVYAGAIGKAQGLSSLVEAARLLEKKCPNIRIVIIGDGIEKAELCSMANEYALQNILFIPRQPIEKVQSFLRLADALLIHLKDDPLFAITIPSKTQAYLAVGKPIIVAVKGNAAQLVAQAEAGISCNPGEPQDIARACEKMYELDSEKLEKMGNNGTLFYKNHLSMYAGVKQFERIFSAVINESNREG